MKITTALRNYWLLSICLLSFFLTWSFCFSLFPLWLHQHIGLSGERTGIIFSINSAAALACMPFYGFLQDKLGVRRHLLFGVGLLLVLSGPFFIYVYTPLLRQHFYLGAVSGGLVFALTFTAAVGTMEAYIERLARTTGFEFGKARLWGSLGWACATFFSGSLFNFNPHYNFFLASGCALIFLLALSFVKPARNNAQEQTLINGANALNLQDAFSLLRMRNFWMLGLFVAGVCSLNTVYDQQFPVYFASFFSSQAEANQTYGQLNSLQVFLEAGGMFLAPYLVNRVGARNGLLLAGSLMSFRMLGSSVADTTLAISVMKLLHAAELPLLLVSMFKYISSHFDARLSGTIFLVGFQFINQTTAIGPAIIAGVLYDTLGFATSYQIMGALVAGFVVISRFTLQAPDNRA